MRKLLILASFFLAILSFIFPVKAFAQDGVSVQEPAIVPAPQTSPIFGQDHYYSVVFRGNGEAVVNLRVALTNTAEDDLGEISLRVPSITIDQLLAYQIIRERACTSYGPYKIDTKTGLNTRECLQYSEPDYYSFYYGQAKYQKAEADFSGDTITITLPNAIAPEKSGSYILYFRSFGYATKDIFGIYKYDFETLKVADSIRNLQVGIDTDADQVLRGAEGEVNYRTTVSLPQAGLGVVPDTAKESSALDTYYQGIGRGSITKTASNLAPMESYKVAGSYAKTRFLVYAKAILIGVLIFLVLAALFIFGLRLLLKRLTKKGEAEEKQEVKEKGTRIALISIGVSFAAAFVMVAYLIAIFFAVQYSSHFINYQYSALIALFAVIVSFAIFTLLLFAPGIYIGLKKSVGWGIATVIVTIVWLIVFMGIAIFVVFLTGPSSYPGPIYPLLDAVRGVSGSAHVAE